MKPVLKRVLTARPNPWTNTARANVRTSSAPPVRRNQVFHFVVFFMAVGIRILENFLLHGG